MSQKLELFEQLLQKHKLSNTAPRREVFLALIDQEPMSMNTLIKSLSDKVNRASVYRTIDSLESIGIIHRIQMGWKYKLELSEAFADHHHHLQCRVCGNIFPITDSAMLENALSILSRVNNFAMESHQVEIVGVCADCRDPRLAA